SSVGSGARPCTGRATVTTSTVGGQTYTVSAQDTVGNIASMTVAYNVLYAASGNCAGAPGHAILQPINADGSSVFKQGSTAVAKFRVCDSKGVSIGTPGVVKSFKLVQTISGTAVNVVNE